MAELLDLDAEVLHSHLSDVTGWLQGQAAGLHPRQILDLGSGTGTGTFALLQRFGDADVIAVDMSAYLLDRLRGKASILSIAGRVRTVQADLDTGWPDTGPVDLVWASSSLHHLADPDRVLTHVFGALRPGGLLAVLEMDSFPRFLPDDPGVGQPGLEARCHAALTEQRAAELPISDRTGARAWPGPGSLSGPSGPHRPPDAPAAPRHRPLRAGIPAADPGGPQRPAERR